MSENEKNEMCDGRGASGGGEGRSAHKILVGI